MISCRELSLLKEKFSGAELERAISDVENGKPLAYALGEWYFYGLTFKLNEACLIPRPDTEHVVDKAIALLPKNGVFCDLCTGSGCIAVSVKKNRPDITAFAIDISPAALQMASLNAAENGAEVNFMVSDLLTSEIPSLPSLDAVISNPPYIRTDVLAELEVAKTEPIIALDGGDDGMRFYRCIIEKYAPLLKENGIFIFEIGYDQREQITALARVNGFSCEVTKDYGGCDRVAVLKRR